MAHGNIYPAEQIDAALANYFRAGQPGARCASSRCCGSPTGSTRRSRSTARTTGSPGPGRPASGSSSRSPARRGTRPSSAGRPAWRRARRRSPRRARRARRRARRAAPSSSTSIGRLLDDLGGKYHEVVGRDVAEALLEFARAENVHPARARREPRSRGDELAPRVGHQPGDPRSGPDRRARHLAPRRARRRATRCPHAARRSVSPVAAARGLGARGGRPAAAHARARPAPRRPRPAERAAAVPARRRRGRRGRRPRGPRSRRRSSRSCSRTGSSPRRSTRSRSPTPRTSSRLVVFVVVAVVVSALVSRVAAPLAPRRPGAGPRPRRWPGSRRRLLGERGSAARVCVAHLRTVVRARRGRGAAAATATGGWSRGGAGDPVPTGPRTAPIASPLDADDAVLALAGARARRPTTGACCRAFAAQLAVAVERRDCAPRRRRRPRARRGERAAHRAARGRVARPAHAARVDQGVGDEPAPGRRRRGPTTRRREFLETIDEETDRLNDLVGNLLDMSRLQTGVARARAPRASGSTRSCPRRSQSLGDDGAVGRRRRARDAARGARRRRAARARRSPTSSRTRWPASPPDRARARRAGRGRTGRVELRIVDEGPGIPPDRARRASSSRSSGSATDARRPASVSVWRSRAGSSRRWTASSRSTTRPAAGSRW